MEITFGTFLRQKRQEKNLTQKELAERLFVSDSAVSKWEKDVAHPDITLLPKLSEILGVSEHELITASIDTHAREEKAQAKKWRAFSMSWSLFFYIAYGAALIPCFICNLAIDKTLSWFWIVVSALLLTFSFTNLPKLIKKYKLLLIPASMYLALCLLLGVCCIYSGGNWFWIPVLSILLGLLMIFAPIYIAKYPIFEKIRKYNDFVSIGVVFVMLNILLITINIFTYQNAYSSKIWYVSLAFPISFTVYLIVNSLVSVRFLKMNKLLKTSIILYAINFLIYLPPLFIKTRNLSGQKESNDLNIFKADLSRWTLDVLENNVHLLVFLTLFALATIFLLVGLICSFHKRKSK